MIRRCHQHQYPQEYGRPIITAVFTTEESQAIAPMVVDANAYQDP
jgi:hypothetical protein